MTTGKTIASTRWTFVGKVMSLLFNMLSKLINSCLENPMDGEDWWAAVHGLKMVTAAMKLKDAFSLE